ncbi:S-adenosyl-L-methionine-dependent methyltransferase [Xylariaceae sp. FL0662B]|nr:S-adenosyl-L-methionine-dependent methyltransferase [Xylariaceae sp. FL0662B]
MRASTTVLYATDELTESVSKYAETHSIQVPQPIKDYHASIIKAQPEDSDYMISTFESQALIWFARLLNAKRILEIGVYIGYSAMVWSHAVGPQGKITGLEYDPKYAQEAETAWKKYGYNNIEVHVGDGAETLPKLAPSEPYDIIFIDANKPGYLPYLRTILAMSKPGAKNRLLRPGGLIMADNALWRGQVADYTENNPSRRPNSDGQWIADASILSLREYNDTVAGHERLESFLCPLWDGLGLARLVD